MMIGARHIHHQFLQQRLLQIHKLHETETGGIPQHCFQNGTQCEEQQYGKQRIEGQSQEQDGNMRKINPGEKGRPEAGQQQPAEQGQSRPHRVMPALRVYHQAGIGHGGQKIEAEKAHAAMKHDGAEMTQ